MEAREPRLSLSSEPERMWLASRLLRRQVVNMTALEPVGRVADVVLDPERCCVSALSIELTPIENGFLSAVRRVLGRQRTVGAIAMEHVVSLHGDVIMIDSAPVRPGSMQRMVHGASLRDICELTILSLHGMSMGSLADVLLDADGRMVTGYVVNPTRQAESLMMRLEDLLPSSFQQAESERAGNEPATIDATPEPATTEEPPPANLRVIPASPRVRIGESLIVVVDDAEPLRQEALVVASPVTDDTVRSTRVAQRLAHHNGFYGWRRAKQSGRH